jgi:hypothetical protein
MKQYFLFLLCCSVLTIAEAQPPKTAPKTTASKTVVKDTAVCKNIRISAESMMAAFKVKDFKTFSQYMNPVIINMLGGLDSFAVFTANQMKDISDTAVKLMQPGRILQIVTTSTDLQCVVEQHMVMELSGFRFASTSHLVGESLDKGKTWTFFDAADGGMAGAKDIKPNISPKLKIPKKRQALKDLD